jgi:hypothetical protein
MEKNMRRIVGIFVSAALVVTAVAFWAGAAMRSDAASKALGSVSTTSQIDPGKMMRDARDLPEQASALY